LPNNKYTNSTLNQTPVTGPFGFPLKNSDGSNNEIRVVRKGGRYSLAIKSGNIWHYINENGEATSTTLGLVKVGDGLAITSGGTLSATGAGANNYLDGITRATNTLTFSVNGATDVPYTFGSNAFTSTTILALGTTAGTALEGDTGVTNWSGGSGGLTASTGRTSLGLGSMAQENTSSYATGAHLAIGTSSTTALRGDASTANLEDITGAGDDSGQILIYALDDDGYNPLVMSGDATMDKDGIVTVANDSHTHSAYSLTTHTHSGYATSSHTHSTSNLTDITGAGDTSGQILIYAEDDTGYNPLVMSGDITMDKDGIVTVANDSHTHSSYITSAYSDLSTNSKIGTGSTQVAQGNHTHSIYMSSTANFGDLADVETGILASSGEVITGDSGEFVSKTLADAGIEASFTKNTAFNKNFGTSSTTVAYGNHTHSVYMSSTANFDDLNDVATGTSPSSGELITGDSGEYISETFANAGVSEVGHTHGTGDISNLDGTNTGDVCTTNHTSAGYMLNTANFGDLADVETGISASSGEVITGDSGEFVSKTLANAGIEASFTKNTAFNKDFGTSSTTVAYGNHTHSTYMSSTANFGDLADVETGISASSGEVITGDSGEFVSKTLANAGISATGHTHGTGDITNLSGTNTGDVCTTNHTSAGYASSSHNHSFGGVNLTDVESGESSMDILLYDSGKWTPSTLAEAGISATSHTHSGYAASSHSHSGYLSTSANFGDLADVETGISASSGEVITGDSGEFVSKTLANAGIEPSFTKNTAFNKNFGTSGSTVAYGNHTHSGYLSSSVAFGDLTDVETGISASSGEVITGDSGEFVSKTLANAGISATGHTHSYLPLSGGTLTNTLTMSTENQAGTLWGHHGGLQMKNSASGYAGIYGSDSGNNFMWQLYGDTNGYGFLNAEWSSWDLRKAPNGVLYFNDNTTYYLNPVSNSHFNTISMAGTLSMSDDIHFGNYGEGIVGVYSATRYQAVFSMGNAYKLANDGTTAGSLYGIAWTHSNIGGQSKSGLGHQALFMDNGVTYSAIGNGIWTTGAVTWSGGGSANANTAYTHSQSSHAPSNANYITNNNQLTNGAGYITSIGSHDHSFGGVNLSDVESGESSMDILVYDSGKWTPSTLAQAGCSATGHTHSYLPLGGGSLSGALTFTSGSYDHEINSASTHSLTIKNKGSNTSGGIVLQGADGTHGMQIYWSGAGGANYGFLTGAWANWDIQKTMSGNMYLNNNSGYYLNPPSNSHFNTISTAGNITSSSGMKVTLDTNVGDNTTAGIYWDSTSTAYAIFRESGAWTHPYPDLCIAFHTGIKMGANAGYGGIRMYTDYNMVTELFSVGDGDTHVRVANNIYWSGGNSANANTAYTHSQSSHSYLPLAGGTMSDNIHFGNYGEGIVGVYASTRYQAVFAMGNSYKLANDGTSTGSLYGIAWTHSNVGGQSKSGLGHQALFMDNGVTYSAIGNGIWTTGNITASGAITGASYTGGAISGTTGTFSGAVTSTYSTTMSPRWDNAFYVLQSQHWYGHNGSQAMYLGESGNDIHTRGTILGYKDITAYYSDSRLKDFHGVIENPLDKVMKLNGYYWTENEKAKELGYNNDRMQVGVSAQEIEKVLPELIKDAPIGHGYKTIDYGKITPLLIEAIKELKNEINQLKGINNG